MLVRAHGDRALLVLAGLALVVWMAVALIVLHTTPAAILGGIMGGAGVACMALNPYWGIHAFIMLLYVENAMPAGEGLSLMKLLGAIIIGSWLLSMAVRRRADLRLDGFMISLGLFLAWCATSLFYAYDSSVSGRVLFTYGQLALATLMFSTVADSVEKMRGIYWAIVVWTLLSTLIAIVMYYGGATRVAVGLMGNRNLFAGYINVAIICAYMLLLATTHRGARLFLSFSLPLFFLGLALTFSRTGLVILVMTLLIVWYRVAREKGFLILVGSAMALSLITLLLPSTFFKRASTIVPAIERQQDTFGTRLRLWKIAARMIEDRPVTGVGVGNFVVAYPRYAHGEMETRFYVTHNTYVGMAAEAGLVGLALYLLLNAMVLREARRAIHAAKAMNLPHLERFAVAAEVSLLSIILGGMMGNVETMKFLWMLFGFAVGLGRVARKYALARDQAILHRRTGQRPPAEAPVWTRARVRP